MTAPTSTPARRIGPLERLVVVSVALLIAVGFARGPEQLGSDLVGAAGWVANRVARVADGGSDRIRKDHPDTFPLWPLTGLESATTEEAPAAAPATELAHGPNA